MILFLCSIDLYNVSFISQLYITVVTKHCPNVMQHLKSIFSMKIEREASQIAEAMEGRLEIVRRLAEAHACAIFLVRLHLES